MNQLTPPLAYRLEEGNTCVCGRADTWSPPRQPQSGTFGCQSVSEMMRFYTEEVLPTARKTSAHHQQSVDDLGNLLLDLKATMRRCHRFFTCEKRSKTMKHIKETFEKMNENGIYKAMGEFDIFINYIEEYLMMKKK
ncbi:PREDICTED: interleukin-10-like [Calidris pugnax]|uniref:interleukin-10-like n=1 Tax=Calidris pugnax TaxID=198806 RepID=UPI00071C57AD|nr:PREDICTED: interleukin-10-like [Calidris pugnax]